MPRLGLRGKLLANFIVILLPMLGLLIYGYSEANERRVSAILDNRRQTAQAVAEVVDASFDEATTLAVALANDPLVRSLDASMLDPYLVKLAANYPQYFALTVIDSTGRYVSSSLGLPSGGTAAGRAYFDQVMATGKPAVSEVLVARDVTPPTAVVVIAAPILEDNGGKAGAVLVVPGLQALGNRLGSMALGADEHILLVDRMGRAALHTAIPDLFWEQRDLSQFEPVRNALAGESTTLRRYISPFLNDTRMGAFVPSPKYGWVVGVGVSEDIALAPARIALRDQLLGFGGVALLSMLLALLLSHALLRPIRRLGSEASALGEGDLSRRVSIKTGDEMEQLGATFNKMAERLDKTITDLRRGQEERQALVQVASALVRQTGLEPVAEIIVEQGRRVLGANTVTLYLADSERAELRLVAYRGLSETSVSELKGLTFNSHVLAAQAARTGQPRGTADATLEGNSLSGSRRIAVREAQRGLWAQPLTAKGHLVGVLSLAKPTVHEFSESERELIAAFADLCAAAVENARLYTELSEMLDLREEFIAAAAHELKTPVTTIKGYAQAMRKWAPHGHEPREGLALEVIDRQCDRITRRVQEMLEAVRLRRTPPDEHRVRFELGDLVEEAVKRLQTTRQRKLRLTREASAMLEADRERIEEVVVSLLDNAIKFSPEGEEVEARVFVLGGDAVFAVRDRGTGIAEERRPHLFEPFYEASPVGAPGYTGVAALSLYLSKLIIELHKGRIWFESEEGEGSTFYFSVPLASVPLS